MHSDPLQIGVTGGIGAGKTVVCRIFQCLGVPVYNADERARYLMAHQGDLIRNIAQSFGEESYLPDGTLNRSFLAKQVFQDADKVQQLNQLVHPEVGKDYQRWLMDHSQTPYVIKEAALMIESGSYKSLDYLVTISAPEEIRLSRVLKRDPQRDRQQILDIMSNQISETQRIEKSDFVLYNDQHQLLIPQVLELHQKFSDSADLPAK